MNRNKAEKLIESEYLDILLRRCPYKISKGKEAQAKDVLRGIIFGGQKGGGE